MVTQLEAGHFFDASITKQHLFASVHDAVIFVLQQPRANPASPVLVSRPLAHGAFFDLLVPTLTSSRKSPPFLMSFQWALLPLDEAAPGAGVAVGGGPVCALWWLMGDCPCLPAQVTKL